MATIVNIYNDNALEIKGEQIANTLQVGTSWKHVRLGFLSTVSCSAATSSVVSLVFAAGVCTGTSSLYGSALGPTHFVGMFTLNSATWNSSFANSGVAAYTINGGSGNDTPPSHTPPQIGVVVLSSSINPTYVTDWCFLGITTGSNSANQQNMTATYIDFIKPALVSTPQLWNIRFYHWHGVNNGANPLSQSKADFYDKLANITASFTSQTAAGWQIDAVDVPVSESIFGLIDSVTFHWSKAIPFHIHEIAVYRFA